MDTRFPDVRAALLAYDPQAKLVNAISRLRDGVYRVSYIDAARKQCGFIYSENGDADSYIG